MFRRPTTPPVSPDDMEPGFHGVRTPWIRGFIASEARGPGPGPVRPRLALLVCRRGQVLDGDRQVVGGRPGLLGVVHAVRAQGGNERPGDPDGVDAPPDSVRTVDVGRVMPGRGLPVRAGAPGG